MHGFLSMTSELAHKECERLYTLGIIAIPTIAVFARDDAHHVWCVRQLGFFTPPVEATVSEPVFEKPPMDCALEDIAY